MADVTLLETILTLERAALDRWCRGDMGGYTGSLAEEATYFDHVTPQLLRGLPAISRHVAGFEGKISIPRHEIVTPVLHHSGDLAVLVFNWDPYGPDGRVIMRWNATSAYRRIDGQWRIIHAQWAKAQAE